MPRSRKTTDPFVFRPVAVEPRRPLEQEWEPNLLSGESVEIPDLESDGLAPDNVTVPGQVTEETVPGSAALAERFEALPMEWVTGEPIVETLRFELSDGLRYVGELAGEEPDGDEIEGDRESPDGLEHPHGDQVHDESSIGQEITDRLHRDRPERADDAFEARDVEHTRSGAIEPGAESEPSERVLSGAAGEGSSDSVGDGATRSPGSGEISGVELLGASGAVREDEVRRALEQGIAQGIAQGIEQGIAQGVAQGIEQGIEQGIARGIEEARQGYEAEFSARQTELGGLIDSIRVAATDSHRLFAPLKRLALHLAEQLVRGELSLSGEAINRLVENVLRELDHSPGNELVLSLNPEDAERWKRVAPAVFDTLELRADPSLSIGSVRVSAGESIIEDLIEHRLHLMAARLLGEVPARGFSRITSLRMQGGLPEDIADVG